MQIKTKKHHFHQIVWIIMNFFPLLAKKRFGEKQDFSTFVKLSIVQKHLKHTRLYAALLIIVDDFHQ